MVMMQEMYHNQSLSLCHPFTISKARWSWCRRCAMANHCFVFEIVSMMATMNLMHYQIHHHYHLVTISKTKWWTRQTTTAIIAISFSNEQTCEQAWTKSWGSNSWLLSIIWTNSWAAHEFVPLIWTNSWAVHEIVPFSSWVCSMDQSHEFNPLNGLMSSMEQFHELLRWIDLKLKMKCHLEFKINNSTTISNFKMIH